MATLAVSPETEAVRANETDPIVITETEMQNGAATEAADKLSQPLIYSLRDLDANRTLLRGLVEAINIAYAEKDKDFSTSLRFPRDQDLIDQWGSKGGNPSTAVIRLGGRIVATSTIFPWREIEGSAADINFRKSRPEDVALVDAGHSYEIGGVATLNGPTTRGKGLATHCIRALEKVTMEGNGGSDILLWLHTAEHQNGAYWRRRGFANVLVETKPIGFWGCTEPFEFVTLVKRVSKRNME